MFKEFQDCKFALAVSSATAALHLGLLALNIKRGDEVIVAAFTHPATANVVMHVGATPIFADIKLPAFTIDPKDIENRITNKTRVIVPVHIFGLSADMDPIMEIAQKFNLKVLEDAACALGAEYKGKKVGIIGECGAFSFHPRKPITTGEGGIFTTNDEGIANTVRILRSHGESLSDELRHKADEIAYPDYVSPGFNYRMTDIQGAIGVEQMKKLPHIMQEKRKIVRRYNELLSDLEEREYLVLPHLPEYMVHVYQSYVILLKERVRASRNELSNKLQKQGIATRKGTYHVPMTKFCRETFGFRKGDFPNSEKADERSLALPLYVGMGNKEIEYVVDNLRKLITKP